MCGIKELSQEFEEAQKIFFADFFEFLRFKSIGAEKEFERDTVECATWVENYLRNAGLSVERWETSGKPCIFAEHLGAGPDKPTILLYNHYDVQPVDPMNLWVTPPFEPTIRDGRVYARGAQDNKGQCMYVMTAIKAMLQRDGGLPINVKLLIEGEEENSSPGLNSILEEKKERLRADHMLVIDVGFERSDSPAITLGVRGVVKVKVEITALPMDLHSGVFGGIAVNPNQVLLRLLSELHDDTGSISIPGFYDDVEELDDTFRSQLNWEFDEKRFEQEYGFRASGGEKGVSTLESNWLRPTLEINGITGGYSGEGIKTIIPAKASANISSRIVYNQDPERILDLIVGWFKAKTPEVVDLKISGEAPGRAMLTRADSPIAKAAAQAFSEVHETPCSNILCGASIPVAAELARVAEAETLLIGYALPEDSIHAPNESFSLAQLKKGYVTMQRILQLLA